MQWGESVWVKRVDSVDYIRGLGCDKWANVVVVVVALGGHPHRRASLENMCTCSGSKGIFIVFPQTFKKNAAVIIIIILIINSSAYCTHN